MDGLTGLSKGGQRLIGNRALRDALGWDEGNYALDLAFEP